MVKGCGAFSFSTKDHISDSLRTQNNSQIWTKCSCFFKLITTRKFACHLQTADLAISASCCLNFVFVNSCLRCEHHFTLMNCILLNLLAR